MQFLVKHNGSKGFLEKGDNLQEEVFSDDCRNAKTLQYKQLVPRLAFLSKHGNTRPHLGSQQMHLTSKSVNMNLIKHMVWLLK